MLYAQRYSLKTIPLQEISSNEHLGNRTHFQGYTRDNLVWPLAKSKDPLDIFLVAIILFPTNNS